MKWPRVSFSAICKLQAQSEKLDEIYPVSFNVNPYRKILKMDFDESFLASQDFEETVSGTFFQ